MDMAQLGGRLPTTHEALDLIPPPHQTAYTSTTLQQS